MISFLLHQIISKTISSPLKPVKQPQVLFLTNQPNFELSTFWKRFFKHRLDFDLQLKTKEPNESTNLTSLMNPNLKTKIQLKLLKLFTNNLAFKVNKNVNELYLNLLILHNSLMINSEIKFVIVENFNIFDKLKNSNKVKKDFLVRKNKKIHKLGLKPYQKIYEIIDQIISEFNLTFFLYKNDPFFKGSITNTI